MIDASQRMLTVNSQGELGGLSPPQRRHLELEIKTLQNAPRDAEKLEKLLKAKQRQKEEAMHIEGGIDKELKRLHDVTGLALNVMIGFS
jgi:hypothetical protein